MFSSGGGYSLTFDEPQYQKAATAHYLDVANVSWPYFTNGEYQESNGVWNRGGRGVPDIAAVGKRIATFLGFGLVGAPGTSASTPIVAALFNRIVEERLRLGKRPLGFVNPILYKHPEVLNEIVTGSNSVGANCLVQRAFECAPGLDPVTGLGTPDYPKLLDLFTSLP
ncbi:hypothetical protein LTR37_015109 [Vermiconidia calcicola]|uniref:Uncharacterized protein n=1 Tax=Vermiconidia calcicola TaxID=1690605 RepID=A0ACC3MTC6_9PEZI|nr:hypothetical protein LTR37_015109 [Vermiconidia calcicola]